VKQTSVGKVNFDTFKRVHSQEFQGVIHSIFDHTINVVLNKQIPNMLTLGGRRVRGSPNSVFLENFQELKSHIFRGQKVNLAQGKLFIDPQLEIKFRIDTVGTSEKHNTLPSNLSQKIEKLNILELKSNPYTNNPAYRPFLTPLLCEIQSLKQALIGGEHIRIRKNGQRLIGLGVGLTPSGDDVLTGLFLTLNSLPKCKEKVVEDILGKNGSQLSHTNLISQHQLYFAALGEGKANVLSFIEESDPELIEERAQSVLEIGSTSGFDTLLGIKLAMEFMRAEEIEKIEMEKN